MKAKLAHQVLDDGRVLVSFVGRDAVHVDLSEAKRFAWALLADIDPDGVKPTRAEKRQAAPRRQTEVLRALSRGKLTSVAICEEVGGNAKEIVDLLQRLAQRGLAVQMCRGYRGRPATWGLTTAGAREAGTLAEDRRTPDGLREVLHAVADGMATRTRIAAVLGIEPHCAHMRLKRLNDRGLVYELVRGRPHAPTIWELTDAGRAELGETRPIDRAA